MAMSAPTTPSPVSRQVSVPRAQSGPQPVAPRRSRFARHRGLPALSAVVVLGLATTLTACDGAAPTDSTQATGTTVATEQNQPDTAQDPATQEAGTEEATEEPDPAITFPGMQSSDIVTTGGQTITSNDVQITTTLLTAGDATFGPTACTSVTIVNNSANTLDVNAFDFTLQTPTGSIINTGFFGTDNHLQASTLIAGGSVVGDVCFDQDLTDGGQYVVLYKPLLSFLKDRVAWVNTL